MAIQLTDPIARGSRIRYTASWNSQAFHTTSEIAALVANYLSQQWGITVEAVDTGCTETFSLTDCAVFTVIAPNDFNQLSNFKSILDGAFYNAPQEIGNLDMVLISSAVLSVQSPGGSEQSTGAKEPPTAPGLSLPKLSTTGWVTIGVVLVATVIVFALILEPTAPARAVKAFR